jgi:K+-transporting ATPase ATPase C chain
MQSNKKQKWRFRQAISLALLSLLICGIFFPLLVTGLAPVLFPNQANGEIVQFNGQAVGSNLIAQNFTLPIFFHPRNDSASGVDPDITLQDAYSQIPRIQSATGITKETLNQMVNQNTEGTYWIFGTPYVNVLRLNLALVKTYPSVYAEFQ